MEPALADQQFALKDFGTLSALSDENIARVAEAIISLKLPAGAKLHANLEQGWLLYLITGQLTVINDLGERLEWIEENTDRAYQPLFVEGCRDFHVHASEDVELIRIDRLHVEVLLARQLSDSTCVSAVSYDSVDTEVFASILEAHETGSLQVPSLPEVASTVNNAVRDNDMDFNRLAAIIQRDPPYTARLIQVANSPAYRGAAEIETLSSAISRLGLDGTRNLVMAIAVEQLVQNVHPTAVQALWDYYREASEVACLCFVLARKTGCLREERAYMAGLLHGLGMVPIVNHACQVLAPNPDMGVVERVGKQLVEPVSSWLLSEWGLDAALCDAAESATDWYYVGEGDLGVIEFVIAARLLRIMARGERPPADIALTDIGKRLGEIGLKNLDDPAVFLSDLQDEVETARQLLG